MPFEEGQSGNPEKVFKEGQSGNPSGRPKGSRNRSTIAREMLALLEKVKNPITQKEEELDQEAIMTLAQINKARKGDTRAYIALMDSAHGQAKSQSEISLKGIDTIIPGDEE